MQLPQGLARQDPGWLGAVRLDGGKSDFGKVSLQRTLGWRGGGGVAEGGGAAAGVVAGCVQRWQLWAAPGALAAATPLVLIRQGRQPVTSCQEDRLLNTCLNLPSLVVPQA